MGWGGGDKIFEDSFTGKNIHSKIQMASKNILVISSLLPGSVVSALLSGLVSLYRDLIPF